MTSKLFYVKDSELCRYARVPLPKSVEEALDQSIEKWRYIRDWLREHPGKTLKDGGRTTCGLCLWGNCYTCIIGTSTCEATPFEDYENAQYFNNNESCLKAAEAEMVFLEGKRAP